MIPRPDEHGHCEFCGRAGKDSPGGLHVGHMMSVDDGHRLGLPDTTINDDENLAAACAECNLGASKRTVTARMYIHVLMARQRVQT